MFLSRLQLDITKERTIRCIQDCQKMHQYIQSFFENNRVNAGVLYRINPDNPDRYTVYMLSNERPRMDSALLCREIDMFRMINQRKIFSFNILTAPFVKQDRPDKKNSVRYFLPTPRARLEWLQKKGAMNGFTILDLVEGRRTLVTGKHETGPLNFPAYTYKGCLNVTNTEKFLQAWQHGIGAGKAYGLGMLLLQ